jgi:hypothetical protein
MRFELSMPGLGPRVRGPEALSRLLYDIKYGVIEPETLHLRAHFFGTTRSPGLEEIGDKEDLSHRAEGGVAESVMRNGG